MIKLEITDINELNNLPIINEQTLKKYLEEKYPQHFEEGERLSFGDIEETLQYISNVNNTDNICEIFLDMGADITVTYGYIIG